MTIPLPLPTRFTDLTEAQIGELRQSAQDTADDHGWLLSFVQEPQPGGLFSAVVKFSVAAPAGSSAVAGPPSPPSPTAPSAPTATPTPPTTAPSVASAAASGPLDFAAGGRPMTQAAVDRAAASLGSLDPVRLWALFLKETPGAVGFMKDRRPLILYERHVFSRCSGARFDAAHPDISARNRPYVAGASGFDGYGTYPQQYDRLARAMVLDPTAALMACSWGIGQTLGEGFEGLGYDSVQDLVARMIRGEDDHIDGVVREINHKHAAGALSSGDLQAFARAYNGQNAPPSYAIELGKNVDKYKAQGLPDVGLRASQLCLAYLGFLPTSGVDGRMGNQTRTALAHFQTAQGMPASGENDPETVAKVLELAFP